MPIYEFWCDNCGKEFEEITSASNAQPVCPHCGSHSTRKLMSACCRHKKNGSSMSDYSSIPSSGGGCAGCSGGNCSTCGH